MRRLQFGVGEFYHVYNRGVEKRTIFSCSSDYERFLFLLFACNDIQPLLNSQHYYRGFASIDSYSRERDLLVDIICICLMPNHFHLMLYERQEGGISSFMQKVSTGYAMYFNQKYKRSGVLFQGVFKAIHINRDDYLLHLSRYIHLNPVDLKEAKWKEKGIKHTASTYGFLKVYPWSSYRDYLGEGKLAPLLNMKIIQEQFFTSKKYEQFMNDWLVKDLSFIADKTIETIEASPL